MVDIGRRIAEQTGLARVALALGAGAGMALAQTPVDWPLAYFLTLPVLLYLLDGTERARGGFALGWLAGVGYFAGALFWIVEPFLVDPERHAWLAPLALAGMVGGLALFWGAAFGIARAVWPEGSRRILLLAALWTVAEMARSYVLTGFPWALLAYGWVETPVIQVAALTGPHVLGFLTLVAALLPGLGSWRAAALSVALVGGGWSWGAWRLAQPLPERDPVVAVRLVQPNADQREKWNPERQAEFHRRLLEATRAPGSPDVTIWPETAVPFPLDFEPDAQAEIAEAVGPDGRLILGMLRAEPTPASWDWVNALVVLEPAGSAVAVYDKHHLVPFGEYIPLADVIAGLGLPGASTLTNTGFRPGPGPRLLEVEGLPSFLPLICYEAIFPQGFHAPGGRPEWLVQVTNDAWFGTISGPYQHLAQARVRAIEQGLPLARAANTGVSAMIDARGTVVASLPLGVAGYLDVPLPRALPTPAYARTGDLPGLMALLTIAGLTLVKFGNGVSHNFRG